MDASAFPTEVGHRIRRRRQMLGWSQRELARRLAIPQSQLSRLELGGFKHIDITLLGHLIEVLQTSAAFLLARSDDPGEVPLLGCPAEGRSLDGTTPLPVSTILHEEHGGEEYSKV